MFRNANYLKTKKQHVFVVNQQFKTNTTNAKHLRNVMFARITVLMQVSITYMIAQKRHNAINAKLNYEFVLRS